MMINKAAGLDGGIVFKNAQNTCQKHVESTRENILSIEHALSYVAPGDFLEKQLDLYRYTHIYTYTYTYTYIFILLAESLSRSLSSSLRVC